MLARAFLRSLRALVEIPPKTPAEKEEHVQQNKINRLRAKNPFKAGAKEHYYACEYAAFKARRGPAGVSNRERKLLVAQSNKEFAALSVPDKEIWARQAQDAAQQKQTDVDVAVRAAGSARDRAAVQAQAERAHRRGFLRMDNCRWSQNQLEHMAMKFFGKDDPTPEAVLKSREKVFEGALPPRADVQVQAAVCVKP